MERAYRGRTRRERQEPRSSLRDRRQAVEPGVVQPDAHWHVDAGHDQGRFQAHARLTTFNQEAEMRRTLAGVAAVVVVSSTAALSQPGTIQGNSGAEPCTHSPLCAWGRERNIISHEVRTPDLGFAYAYPFALPAGGGGVAAVAINSKGHLFAFQRNAAGKPQLFEFDQNHTLIRSIGDDAIGHQNKAHGMAIDAEDNVWICDEHGDTVMKLSPEGKVLMTIGVRGQRGDWIEEKGQRLLWQPLHLAFAPNGDIYIGEGHANESRK